MSYQRNYNNGYNNRYSNDGSNDRFQNRYDDRNTNSNPMKTRRENPFGNNNNDSKNKNTDSFQNKDIQNKDIKDNNKKDDNKKDDSLKIGILESFIKSSPYDNTSYSILKVESDLDQIKKCDYKVSPTYSGKQMILCFFKDTGKYYSLMFNKNSINKDKSINKNTITLTDIRCRINENMYDGTLLDGIYIESVNTFIVTNVYLLYGNNYTGRKLFDKLAIIEKANKIVEDSYANTIKLEVNQLYDLQFIGTLINSHIIKSPLKSYIKGVAFCPDFYQNNNKLIYLFNNACSVEVDHTANHTVSHSKNIEVMKTSNNIDKEQNKNIDKEQNKNSVIEKEDISDKTLTIKKTGTPDVYELYDDASKIGVAYVPSIKCSHFCKKLLKNQDSSLVICQYDKDKSKWIPIKKAD